MCLVKDLIDSSTRKWKAEVVRNTFEVAEADLILRIPLEEEVHEDEMAWSGEPSGVFFVRSAYKLLQPSFPTATLNNLQTSNRNLYRKLWNLDLTEKIKILIWCIINYYVSTRSNILHQRLIADAMCPICRNRTENLLHVFSSSVL